MKHISIFIFATLLNLPLSADEQQADCYMYKKYFSEKYSVLKGRLLLNHKALVEEFIEHNVLSPSHHDEGHNVVISKRPLWKLLSKYDFKATILLNDREAFQCLGQFDGDLIHFEECGEDHTEFFLTHEELGLRKCAPIRRQGIVTIHKH